MIDSNILEVISTSKIHLLLAFIPLITFVLSNQNIWLLFFYTTVFAIWTLYCQVFGEPFKKEWSNIYLVAESNNFNEVKKRIKRILPYPSLSIMILVFVIIAFGYSFIISILHIKESIYYLVLFLGHIFLITFMIYLALFLNHYKDIIKKEKIRI